MEQNTNKNAKIKEIKGNCNAKLEFVSALLTIDPLKESEAKEGAPEKTISNGSTHTIGALYLSVTFATLPIIDCVRGI